MSEWPEALKAGLKEANETVISRGGAANMPATFARHPDLFFAWSRFMDRLVNHSVLPGRSRELITMRTAWLDQSPLVWVTHAGPAPQVGITKAEVEQVIVGPSDVRWSASDRALLTAVDQFIAKHDMDDATWAAVRRDYDDKQLMELMMLVQNYQLAARMTRTLRIDLGPDFPGLRQR